jgi:hypothetical protein
LLIAARLKRA